MSIVPFYFKILFRGSENMIKNIGIFKDYSDETLKFVYDAERKE